LRFFHNKRLFPHEVIQRQWSHIDYRKNMSIIGLVQKGGHKEIAAIGSYAMETEQRAEVAFVTREDYQGLGIALYLLEVLEKIARENGYTGFTATVLRENAAMLHVFKKKYPHARTSVYAGSGLMISMDFDASETKI
jgi:GNAT superfamily N-acetyltransferase